MFRPAPHSAILALPMLLLLSAAGSAAPAPKLPPGVFRGSLDGAEGPMIFLAVNERMTLAYDERGGSLFLAWDGRALPSSAGPAPSAAPGPLYAASGPAYHRRLNPRPWSVTGPKGNIPVTVALKGVSAHGGLAVLSWILKLPDGRRISVRETPNFDDHYGDRGLFRSFAVTGIPAGMAIRLDLGGRGMEETWGGGATGGVIQEQGRPFLHQEADGETPLKVTWSAPRPPVAPALRGDFK